MRIDGRTMVAGLIGRPIAHSLSPALHNAWLAASGINGVYAPFELTGETAIEPLVQALRGGGSVRGLNVTAPFKEAALDASDSADSAAKAAGAANLLLFRADGSVHARNTDGIGLLRALYAQAGFDPDGATVVVLGAGGAARGAVTSLLAAGAFEVRVINRTLERAQALADLAGPSCRAGSLADVSGALRNADLLVNAATAADASVVAALTVLRLGAVVMDMTYRPLSTALLAGAEQLGLRTVDGLEMLIGQAVPSFEAFYGRSPPPIDIRSVALAAMDRG